MADQDLSTGYISALHRPASLLPIARHRESLLYLIETYPITIVVGQTGSGKTTQIPQFLEQAGWCNDGKVIAVTQVSRTASNIVFILNTCSTFVIAPPSGGDDGRSQSGG